MSEQTNTDEQKYGRESVEQSLNYEKMPMAIPDPPKDLADGPVAEEEESFGAKEAARFLHERRRERQGVAPAEDAPSQNEPIPRAYLHQGGEDAGKPMPDSNVVELDRASRDLSEIRESERAAEATQLDADLAAAVDQLRAGNDQQQGEQPQPEQSQPQPEQPARSPWEDPAVIAGVSEYAQQTQAAVAGLQQQYINDLAAKAGQVNAAIFVNYPELQGLQTIEQLQGAINAISTQSPERAQQIINHINEVRRLDAAATEVQQRQAQAQYQQHRQAFDYYAKQSDDAFETWAASRDTPERVAEISGHARELLHSEGLNDQQLAQMWNTDGNFRSVLGQKILYLAAKASLLERSVQSKQVKTAPTVQRPGSPVERSSDQEYALRDLNQKLNTTHSAKDAAALLTARRSGRR